MDSDPDVERGPGERRVIEPTSIIGGRRAGSWMDDLDLFREGDGDGATGGAEDDTQDLPVVPAKSRTAPAPPDASEDEGGARAAEQQSAPRAKSRARPKDRNAANATSAAWHGSAAVSPIVRRARREAPSAPPPPTRRRKRRRVRLAAMITAGGGAALALALVLLAHDNSAPSTPDGTPSPGASAPPGSDTPVLQQGDSGPAVSDLQNRLLRIPEVYKDGRVNGRYDGVLTEAVARFQLWYGIRGDEDGVYGDDTRRDLESRT